MGLQHRQAIFPTHVEGRCQLCRFPDGKLLAAGMQDSLSNLGRSHWTSATATERDSNPPANRAVQSRTSLSAIHRQGSAPSAPVSLRTAMRLVHVAFAPDVPSLRQIHSFRRVICL